MKKDGKWAVEHKWSILKESEQGETFKMPFYQNALLTAFCIWKKKYPVRQLSLAQDNGNFNPEFIQLKTENERIKQRLAEMETALRKLYP